MMLEHGNDAELDGEKTLRKLVDHGMRSPSSLTLSSPILSWRFTVPTMGAAIVAPADISQLLIKAMKSCQLTVQKLGINAVEVLFKDSKVIYGVSNGRL
jgi:hypothetical protein